MKKWLPLVAVLLTLSVQIPVLLRAEGPTPDHKGSHPMDEHENDRLEHMTKKLKLTTDQQSKVKTALDAKREKMKALRDTFTQGLKSANDEFDSSVLAVLDDNQKKTYAEMKEKREAKMKEWKDHHKEKMGEEK